MRNVWTIAVREYNRFFASAIAYVVASVILGVIGGIFALVIWFAQESALQGGGFGAPPPAPDMGAITWWFAFMLLLAAPALTMRLVADENRMGTMELLLTAPLRDWELIVGKWLGGFLLILTLIAVTLVYPLILNNLESPGLDQSQMMTAYLGVILVAAALLALGVGISSLFSNQFAAFFVSLGMFIFLYFLVGFPAQIIRGSGGEIFSYLSLQNHFANSLNRGIINLTDIVYYLSLTALGLFVGTMAVETRRWS